MAATQPTFPQTPHTVTTKDIKTNMCHIHTFIVSRHQAIRSNNKILRTRPPHISSSEKYFPNSLVAPLPNSEQINHSSSKYTYTKLTPNHIHLQLHPHTHHVVTHGLVNRHSWSDGTAGHMDTEAGCWTSSKKIGTPTPY